MGTKTSKLSPKTIGELQKHMNVNFTSDEIQEWYEEFKTSCDARNTVLTRGAFKEVYQSMFTGNASEFADHVFRTFDTNNDGTVDFQEFIVGLCVSSSDDQDRKIKWAFKMYDIDGDGYITRDEMICIIGAIYKMTATPSDVNTPETMTEKIFGSLSLGNENKLSWEEFVTGVRHLPMIVDMLHCSPLLDEDN